MRLVVDQQQAVTEWVASRIPQVGSQGFGKATSIGVVALDGRPMAGAVYHDYHPEFRTIMISFAADNPRWATHNILALLLGYPFRQLAIHKLRAAVPHSNARSLKLVSGIGFTSEGTLKDEFGAGTHAVMWRLFERDYARIYETPKARAAA